MKLLYLVNLELIILNIEYNLFTFLHYPQDPLMRRALERKEARGRAGAKVRQSNVIVKHCNSVAATSSRLIL